MLCRIRDMNLMSYSALRDMVIFSILIGLCTTEMSTTGEDFSPNDKENML